MASNSPFGSSMYGRETLSGYQKSILHGAGQLDAARAAFAFVRSKPEMVAFFS